MTNFRQMLQNVLFQLKKSFEHYNPTHFGLLLLSFHMLRRASFVADKTLSLRNPLWRFVGVKDKDARRGRWNGYKPKWVL